MKFGIIDITNNYNEIQLKSIPLDISEEYASKAVKFLEKKLNCRFKLNAKYHLNTSHSLIYEIHGHTFFVNTFKSNQKEKDFRYYVTIYSRNPSPKELLEIFNSIIMNRYCLRFIYFIDKFNDFLSFEIKSLEKLFIEMELEA